jgi:hypothetical protein
MTLDLEYINFSITIPTGCEFDATLASILNLSCLMWPEERSLDEVIDMLSCCFKIKTSINDDTSQESKYRFCQWCNWWHRMRSMLILSQMFKMTFNVQATQIHPWWQLSITIWEFWYSVATDQVKLYLNSSKHVDLPNLKQNCTIPVLYTYNIKLAILLNLTPACIWLSVTTRSLAIIPKLAVLTLPRATSQSPLCSQLQQCSKLLICCSKFYTTGLLHQCQRHYIQALEEYKSSLAFTRMK